MFASHLISSHLFSGSQNVQNNLNEKKKICEQIFLRAQIYKCIKDFQHSVKYKLHEAQQIKSVFPTRQSSDL